MSEEETEAEKAKVWLMGQKIAKMGFNRESYIRNKEAREREEAEEGRIEEEEENKSREIRAKESEEYEKDLKERIKKAENP